MAERAYRVRGTTSFTKALRCLSLLGLVGCADEALPSDVRDDDDTSEEREPATRDDDEGEDESDAAGEDAGEDDGNGDSQTGGRRDAGSSDAGANGSDGDGDDTQGDAAAEEPDASEADDASANADGDAEPSEGMREDLGEGDGEDVITIGDSWMLLSAGTGIEVSLEKASMRDYRNFGVPGTRLLDEVIPQQYESAKSEDPDIKTVVMTGGGNDIIQAKPADCVDSAFGDVCKQQIDAVGERLVELWAQMSEDGVQDVVLIGYTRKAYLFLPTATLSMSAEYSNENIPPLCAEVPPPLRCHVLDADEVFDGSTREGIHPTNAGYDAIGAAVWELMQAEGMRR